MKRILILVLAFIFTSGLLTACGNVGTGDAKVAAGTETTAGKPESSIVDNANQGIAYNKLTFEEISDIGTLPANIASSIEKLSKSRGFAFFKLDDSFIVSVNSGERKTGGYLIKVKSVEDIEGITKITVEEVSPGKDAIVTEALTYPTAVVKIKGAAENFKVVDINNVPFTLLTMNGDIKEIIAEGVYSGQIDNNSIEIYIDGKPGAFRINASFDNILGELKKDDKVSLSYFVNEHGQQILTRLEKM